MDRKLKFKQEHCDPWGACRGAAVGVLVMVVVCLVVICLLTACAPTVPMISGRWELSYQWVCTGKVYSTECTFMDGTFVCGADHLVGKWNGDGEGGLIFRFSEDAGGSEYFGSPDGEGWKGVMTQGEEIGCWSMVFEGD